MLGRVGRLAAPLLPLLADVELRRPVEDVADKVVEELLRALEIGEHVGRVLRHQLPHLHRGRAALVRRHAVEELLAHLVELPRVAVQALDLPRETAQRDEGEARREKEGARRGEGQPAVVIDL